MKLIKYLTKRDLLEASRAAIRERRSRLIPEEIIERFFDDMRVVANLRYHSHLTTSSDSFSISNVPSREYLRPKLEATRSRDGPG